MVLYFQMLFKDVFVELISHHFIYSTQIKPLHTLIESLIVFLVVLTCTLHTIIHRANLCSSVASLYEYLLAYSFYADCPRILVEVWWKYTDAWPLWFFHTHTQKYLLTDNHTSVLEHMLTFFFITFHIVIYLAWNT